LGNFKPLDKKLDLQRTPTWGIFEIFFHLFRHTNVA
jgi:hypothetical protein